MDNTQNLTDEELIEQITDRVFERILAKIAKDLEDGDIDEIDKLNKEDKSGKKVRRYLYEKIPNLESIIFEELQQIRKQNLA